MRVRKMNQVDVKLHDLTKVKLKTAGNKVYNVDFSRTYYLQPTYRVYDTEGKVGITSNNEEITLN